jgi:hypothetical protein
VPLFPVVLMTHIALALALILPSLLLPFALRAQRRARHDGERGRLVRSLLWLETHGTTVTGAGVAITGVLLILIIGPAVAAQGWLAIALLIYATVLVVAFFVQRPALMAAFGAAARPDDPGWRERAKRLRYLSYGLAAMVGAIAFLMTQKPTLW